MANDSSRDIQQLWQEQPVDGAQVSLSEVRRRAQRFQRGIRWRNLREHSRALIVAAAFGYYIFRFPTPMVRVGSLLTVIAALFVAWQIRTRGSSRDLPAELSLSSCLEFHIRELERQRDLLRSVWRWYLLPWVPGMALFLPGFAIEQLHGRWTWPLAIAGGMVLLFSWVAKRNLSASRYLDRQIEELKALNKEE